MNKTTLLALLTFAMSCQSPDGANNPTQSGGAGNIAQNLNEQIETISISELLNRFDQEKEAGLYVYNFWATWCKPCVKELPYFEQINADYAAKGVKVVLVSLDEPEHLQPRVMPFVEKKGLKSKVFLLDAGNPNEWVDKISAAWSGAIPATLVVRPRDGKRAFYERDFTYEELQAVVESLM